MVSIESGLPVFDPGRLTHKLDIQQLSGEQLDDGSRKQSWGSVRRPWGSIELLGSQAPREFAQGGQISAESTHVIVIHYHPLNLNASLRVACGNQIYKVKSVDNVMQTNTWIQLFCVVFNQETNPDSKVTA